MLALQRLIMLDKEAYAFGLRWRDQKEILEHIIAECHEVSDAIEFSPEKVQEEIGDVLHTAVALCIFSGFDVEDTLEKVNHKFATRMSVMRFLSKELGLDSLEEQPIDLMVNLWKKAKALSK